MGRTPLFSLCEEETDPAELGITEAEVAELMTKDIKQIIVDFSMSENHIGGDDLCETVDDVLAALEEGYRIVSWYGPETEVLIIGIRRHDNFVILEEDGTTAQARPKKVRPVVKPAFSVTIERNANDEGRLLEDQYVTPQDVIEAASKIEIPVTTDGVRRLEPLSGNLAVGTEADIIRPVVGESGWPLKELGLYTVEFTNVDLKVWVVPTIESDNVKAQEADADEAKNQADKAWRPDEDEPPRASERFFDNPNQSKD